MNSRCEVHRVLKSVGMLAAAALTFAACSSSDNEVLVSESAPPLVTNVVPQPGTASVSSAAPAETGGASTDPAAGCPPAEGTDAQTQQFDSAPPFCLDPAVTYTAEVSTSAGDITIKLDQAAAPLAVNNFVFLARNNYFNETVCHRIIQEFVAQCGDPTATGTGGPGYAFADELPAAGAYTVGSFAMANSGPNTNGSQFFIITGANGAALPPLYSLFGQVDEADLAVVASMNALGSVDSGGIPTEELRILDVTITQS
jgi:cyclophilin family peptidyl-prolyl cis-trans isomerase